MRSRWVTEILASYEGDHHPAHTYLGTAGEPVTRSRAELLADLRRPAGGLATMLRPRDRVALVAAEPGPFVAAFLGALWAGLVPVPVPPPPAIGRHDRWRDSLAGVLAATAPRLLCAPAELLPATTGLGTATAPYEQLATAPASTRDPVPCRPDQTSYLQLSSGSTARPRAVAATAGAITANGTASMREGLAADPDRDCAVSWLPLHHDMGLVGFVLAPLTVGLPVALLPTARFVRDPGVWMQAMHLVGGTLTFAPNFAFALAARRVRADQLSGLDLRRVRVLGCGGEPINPTVIRTFVAAYAPAGLDPAAVLACYGLAESTLAVTFAPRESPLAVDRVRRTALRDLDLAEPTKPDPTAAGPVVAADVADPDVVEVPNCGRGFAGHELQVVDGSGRRLPDRAVGEIWVRGPSVARSYLGEPAASRRTFGADGWLRTGDRGYLVDGSLHVTGRCRDLLVVNGRNTDPHSVEWLVEMLPGVRAGGVVAFTCPDEATEQVVVVAEARPSAAAGLSDLVRREVSEQLGLAVHDVVLRKPRTIAKTTSGKPRRQEMRRRYLAGEL